MVREPRLLLLSTGDMRVKMFDEAMGWPIAEHIPKSLMVIVRVVNTVLPPFPLNMGFMNFSAARLDCAMHGWMEF